MVAWAMSSSLVGTIALTTLMWSLCSLIVGTLFGFWTFTRNANLVATRLRGTASPLEPTRPLRPKDALWIIPLGIVMFVALDYLPALVSTEWLSVAMAGFVGWGLSSGLLVRNLESTVQEELDRGLLDPELVSQSPPGLRDLLGPRRMRMLLAVGLIALAAGLSSIWFGFSMLHSVTYSEPTRETVLTIKRAVTVWLPLGSTLLGATVLGATVDLLLWPLLLSRKLRSANRRQTIVLLNMGQRERLNWEALRVKYTRRASWSERAALFAATLGAAGLFASIVNALVVSWRGLESDRFVEWFVARLLLSLMPMLLAAGFMMIALLVGSSVLRRRAREHVLLLDVPED